MLTFSDNHFPELRLSLKQSIGRERGGVRPGAGPRERGGPGGPGLEVARPFGQQGESVPERLSQSEISTVALERAKEQEQPTELTDSLYFFFEQI